jgi:N-acetyl-anhydromuramyl-L-alanine amidase AmpD
VQAASDPQRRQAVDIVSAQTIDRTGIVVGHGIVTPDRIKRTLPGQRFPWTNIQARFNHNSRPPQGVPAGLQASSVQSIAMVAIAIGRRLNS